MFYTTTYDSPVGELTLASDGTAVCGLWLAGQKYFGGSVSDPMEPDRDAAGFALLRNWLDAYFGGERPSVAGLALAPRGSAFRQEVWKLLLEIPYGQTTTYGSLADRLRATRGRASALAVGGAVGHNPISIVVPCHRVVGADGSLTGYAGGIERKLWLLEHEGVDTGALYVPTRGTAL